ncbi:diguanylate cyclase [Pseudomonas sp. C2L12B]|uniref:diguanylate cyclase n=2 Tax=Pseudomonas typographi TaxID=2715964 RepID=A0ABR7Z1H8_9PSED|nr:diguanylate cyclase [Pseudomonas typographi]MBD1551732.1 diguanylate cyclase [Pseudomonas typographi]MBD1587013.1 diguanylate cyclase [Pseudomonas typographi]MBD1599252.1 diguanylate cyclase [Pseudomonas typographi]
MGRERPLGHRLVVATLCFCLLFTVATVSLRTWFAWHSGRANMAAELNLVDQIFQGPLAKAVWELDSDSLDAQLDSVAQAAPVGRVTLHIARPGRDDEVLLRQRAAFTGVGAAPALLKELAVSPYPGAHLVVGTLFLEGDPNLLWHRLWRELAFIITTQLVQSVALAGLIMMMFNRLVTVHVRHIARHLGELTPQTLGTPLRLERLGTRNDELDLLQNGINHLQASMGTYLARQRRAEQALAHSRDQLAEQVDARTAELKAANASLHALSRHDPLTGLANRRYFDEVKETEFRRAVRSEQPLAVLMCDVDYFKAYNDHHGHGQGDECLKLIAGVMQHLFNRTGELCARLGGEEFAVVLPSHNNAQARLAAERLRQGIVALALPHGASPVAQWVTLSIGIAQLDATMTGFDQLLQRADQALYRAKADGRDRVHS